MNYFRAAKLQAGTLISIAIMFACTSTDKGSEFMKITPSDAYHMLLSSPIFPDATFSLWMPELVILDHDRSRASCVERNDWYEYTDNGISVVGETEGKQSVFFECILTPIAEDEILMVLNITNRGVVPLSDYAQLAVCLSPDQEVLHDSMGIRTFVNAGNNHLLPISENGEAGGFNHYPVGNLTDPNDTEERNHIADGYVARTSQDEKLTFSVCWDESSRVDVNPGGLKCIHSHPAIGPLGPGETVTRTGLIMIKKSPVQDNYKLMQVRLSEYSRQ